MELRPIPHTDLNVSPIALGGWLTFGHSVEGNDAGAIVHASVDAGINFIDVADSYAKGDAERAIGACLGPAANGGIPRERLVIASKVFWPTGDDPNDKGLARARIYRQLEFSLTNLRTDYLDLYFCHNWDPNVPVESTVETMDGLIKAGKIRYWAISNWPHQGVHAAFDIAARNGWRPPVLNQPGYSLLDRQIERWLLPTIARHDLSLVTYSPLAGGLLAGGVSKDVSRHRLLQAKRRGVDAAAIPDALDKVRRLEAIATRLGRQTSQVAIAWLLTRPFITSVIMGASSVAQAKENAAAADVKLDPTTLREIASIFPPVRLGPADMLRLMPLATRPRVLRRYLRWRSP